jgi:hypothetical protein
MINISSIGILLYYISGVFGHILWIEKQRLLFHRKHVPCALFSTYSTPSRPFQPIRTMLEPRKDLLHDTAQPTDDFLAYTYYKYQKSKVGIEKSLHLLYESIKTE